jgi:DNA-binding NtrC family response regulator
LEKVASLDGREAFKMAEPHRALVIDDEPVMRKVVSEACRRINFNIHEAERGDEGLRLLEGNRYDLLLSDFMMPGIDGLELVTRARRLWSKMPIVLITGYATTDRTASVMAAGADYVLEKPIGFDALQSTIKRLVIQKKSEGISDLETHVKKRSWKNRFISKFQGEMHVIPSLLERVGKTSCTALIEGESGTGKELIAYAIHENSPRKSGPFVPVNCGAIPESLLESELFGHCRGAFTGASRDRPGRFALANGGTIFLDEIGEMSPTFQVKLLRVLQEQSFEPVGSVKPVSSDFRVIAATHRNLRAMVEKGAFREDLFYRLNVFKISLPALRNRIEDFELLVEHFIKEFNKKHGLEIEMPDKKLVDLLSRYNWPGNIRELENLVERMAILKGSGQLSIQDLPLRYMSSSQPKTAYKRVSLPADGIDFYQAVDDFENSLITQALQRTGGNRNKAANILSLNRTTLVEKMKKKGLL